MNSDYKLTLIIKIVPAIDYLIKIISKEVLGLHLLLLVFVNILFFTLELTLKMTLNRQNNIRENHTLRYYACS